MMIPNSTTTILPLEEIRSVRHGDEYESTVLSGDPEKPGDFYVMRYRILIACDVAHPEDEHATVIAGEISLGLGEKFLTEALQPLKAGSYCRYTASVRWSSTMLSPRNPNSVSCPRTPPYHSFAEWP